MSGAIRTTCPYCGVGCGVLASAGEDGAVSIAGDPQHPANRGALCSKGAALGETTGLAGRLLRPRIGAREVAWNEALAAVASGFSRIIEHYGAESVAFYVSGQLLTEDYYVANKLMKGYIGAANIVTNSRLCMSSAVVAHQRAFGEDLVPVGYEDLECADLLVLVGSNLAWCHPVLFQRIAAAKEARPQLRIVIVDPRRTPTCEIADLHLPLRAGSDAVLFNGLLAWLSQSRIIDGEFLERHTGGAARALLSAENTAGDVVSVARRCGLEAAVVERFYEWFGATERVVSLFSQGVNQSTSGTDKANGLINLHLLTGRIGRPGMGPFSITGQPNAMGGREVGAMATMLAAHLRLEDPGHRSLLQQFWGSPRMAQHPGLKAVDLFEAAYQGRIRALWIMATNPVVSLPNADRVRAALRRCDLVVVSDCMRETDSTEHAHILLPAAAWGEKQGTVTNSERVISRQRRFLPLPGEARPDWWIICQVARHMGFDRGFEFEGTAEIFDEHARLSAAGNAGTRAFDIGALAGLGVQGYRDLEPVRWPVPAGSTQARLFADGRFYHPDGRAQLIAINPHPPQFAPDEDYPLVLNTGRIRDQWHSMGRSGRSARLAAHLPEPFVDLHPADALQFGLRAGSLVRVVTHWGRLVARLHASGEIARGSIFVPIHWHDGVASDARVGALVNPAVDPFSGQPDFKHTPARVEPFEVSWYGFVLARQPIHTEALSWWACAQGSDFLRYEIAGRRMPGDWAGWARRWLGAAAASDWIDYEDRSAGIYRAVQFIEDRIECCLFASPRPDLPARNWLAAQFERSGIGPAQRAMLLAGRPADPALDGGETICACFGVGRRAIEAAIAAGCRDPHSLGQRLRAGTNCGSCVPELRRLIQDSAIEA